MSNWVTSQSPDVIAISLLEYSPDVADFGAIPCPPDAARYWAKLVNDDEIVLQVERVEKAAA